MMKLLFTIVQNEDIKPLIRALVEHDISVTRMTSSGGFLSTGNQTLMIGVETDRLQDALDIIKAQSHRRKTIISAPPSYTAQAGDSSSAQLSVSVGGATVFIVNIEQFIKY